MSILRFRRFTKPQALKRAGRELLEQLFDRFKEHLAAKRLELPGRALPDEAYFEAVSRLLMAPEGLPEQLNEALFAIDEMATPDGQQRLQVALAEAGAGLCLDDKSSEMDLAWTPVAMK
jgi:hypothetical protein